MLYDRPVSALMVEASDSLPSPFMPSDVVAWFGEHYPLVRDTTVRAHIVGLTGNDRNRHHYRWLNRKDPFFYRLPNGTLERFDPSRHLDDESVEVDDDDVVSVVTGGDRVEFFLEMSLEEFLLTNWLRIDWGRQLSIWRSADGVDGHQFTTPAGRLDFLCQDDDTGNLVVVELKRGLPSDRVVGQAARYMGWVQAHVARPPQRVEGMIAAQDTDERLRYAASAIPGLGLSVYEVSFARHRVAAAA